jgi:hypothetical protein
MTLRNLILPLLLTVALSQASNGQTKADKILRIKQAFQKINSDKSLKKKTIEDAEIFLGHATDGGGQLIGYFDKDTVCKIFVTVGLSYGMITDEYYFSKGQVVFVYESEKIFPENDSSDGLNYTKLKLSFEGRYYFENDKLIDKIIKGKRRFEDKDKIASTFLADAKDYVTLVKTKGQ